jgi:hypothetical protein
VTIAGSGIGGPKDGRGAAAEFFEPHGLAAIGNVILVADTDNNHVRAVDLNSAEVTTIRIRMSVDSST